MRAPLTALAVARARRPGRYNAGNNLYLQVAAGGSKSWLFLYMLKGRARSMGLGSFLTVSLAEARDKAHALRKLVAEGIDPLDRRAAERSNAQVELAKSVTFRQAAEEMIASLEAGWRNEKHRAQWKSTLATYCYPIFGDLPVGALDVGLVLKALEPIWRSKPETAGRLRGRIEAVVDSATVRGYRTGENPARWKGHLAKLLPALSKVRAVEHHSALPYSELPSFLSDLQKREGIAARALEFAILTASRTGEVIGAKWSEMDLSAKTWTVPGARMKAGKEHRVPLSRRAIEILKAVSSDGEFVFAGARPEAGLSNMALLETLRRMGRTETTHGFRSSFRDWAAERTNYPREVAEAALAHSLGDRTEAAYRRSDLFEKRRRLMDAWAAFCSKPETKGAVLPLRRHG